MKELNDIVSAAKSLKNAGKNGALATVVKVQGSAYRRPGAKMLFSETGREAGFISAGCLETDLFERARKVMSSNKPTIVSYDTSSTDDLIMGLGLGCNGLVELFVEPLKNEATLDKMVFFSECVAKRQKAAIATVVDVHDSATVSLADYLLVSPEGKVKTTIKEAQLASVLEEGAHVAVKDGLSKNNRYQLKQGEVDVFIEAILPPLPFVIVGAGPDAQPLIKLANELGWYTTLVDHRPAYAKQENFPLADAVVLSRPDELSEHVPIDNLSVVVIMTHNFPTDLKLLEALLPSPARYVGLLGPKSKSDLLLQHLNQDGFQVTKEQLAKLHSPVGLDIGAETPEEIAFSVIAEIKAVLEGRNAGFLKDLDGPIHGPTS